MGFMKKGVWDLYEKSKGGDVNAMKRLFLWHNIHETIPEYYGSMWMAESLMRNKEMKNIFIEWVDGIKSSPIVIRSLEAMFEDENLENYFTEKERNILRLMITEGIVEIGLKRLEDYK